MIPIAEIWIFSENPSLSRQLVSLGNELRRSLCLPLRTFCRSADEAVEFVASGVNEAVIVSCGHGWMADCIKAMEKAATHQIPSLILLGSTPSGEIFASYVAERLKAVRYAEVSPHVIRAHCVQPTVCAPLLITVTPHHWREAIDTGHSGRIRHSG